MEQELVGCCADCEWARRSCVHDKVACGLISGVQHGLISVGSVMCPSCGEFLKVASIDEFLSTVEYAKDEVWTGWASLSFRPESKDSGLITNYCTILNRDNSCNYWEKRK